MKNFLCFGDSNTWGYDPKSGNRFDWGIRWPSILQEKLGFTKYRVIEEGLCGRTTVFEDKVRIGRNSENVLPYLLETHLPLDLIIIMLGTNDCKTIYNTNAKIIGKGIESLLEIIHQTQPNSKVLLISPIHLGNDVWKPEYDPEFNKRSVETSHGLKKVYEEIAQQHKIFFMDAASYATYSLADMEHMDEKNHLKFAEAVFNKIKEIGVINE